MKKAPDEGPWKGSILITRLAVLIAVPSGILFVISGLEGSGRVYASVGLFLAALVFALGNGLKWVVHGSRR